MRKGMSQGLARPAYYDRNATGISKLYTANGVAPHASTTRWTYTVPAGRKAFIQTGAASLIHDAVATTAGYAYSLLQYLPSGGVTSQIIFSMVLQVAVGTSQQANVGVGMSMNPGDQLSGVTADGSVAGSFYYVVSASGLEYDA